MWNRILGSPDTCTKVARAPLWYAHWDLKQTFTDFVPFGGWTKPVMKQNSDNTTICSFARIDEDFY